MRPLNVIGYQLQYLLLKIFYDNMVGILEEESKKIKECGFGKTLFNVPMTNKEVDSGLPNAFMLLNMIDGKYTLTVNLYTWYNESRTYIVTLGRGKHLVNRRVKNELGVILNTFLNEDAFKKYCWNIKKDMESELNLIKHKYLSVGITERLIGGLNVVYEGTLGKGLYRNVNGSLLKKPNLIGKPTFSYLTVINLGSIPYLL